MSQVLVDRSDITTIKALVDKLNALPDYVSPAPIPPSTNNIYHGVSLPNVPWDMTVLSAFEAKVAKEVAIVSYFIGWNANIYSLEQDRLDAIKAVGAIPMITWQWAQIANLTEVISGKYDQSAKDWALKLKAFNYPVLLRWGHEMNLPNYAWSIGVNGNTAAQYVAAWKHLKDIFKANGATNVLWVWCPGVIGYGSDFTSMWPGATYVDWLGLDGYNWSSLNPWLTFTQVFTQNSSYNKMTALSTVKPLMICEWGSTEEKGDKGAWIKNALLTEIPALSRIKAVTYFNVAYDGANWPIESSAGATEGYKAGIVGYKSVWP